MAKALNEETLQDLYAWIDKIPLSRPKRNIARDFSDGVMAAEVVKHFHPNVVDLHNYTPAYSTQQKTCNWAILNRKVFSKFNFRIPENCVKKIVSSTPGFIEPVLCTLRARMEVRRGWLERTELVGEKSQDLQYYQTSQEKPQTEFTQMPSTPTHAKSSLGRQEEDKQAPFQKESPGPVVAQNSAVEQVLRQMVEEKDSELLALQETVEILQIKVSRLEQLLQLKDLHIQDLTRHVERCNRRASRK